MFRRRPIRRPMRRLPRRNRPGIPGVLIEANNLFEAGDYTQAAVRFAALAEAAESRNGPRAPQFFFQAGRASLLAGQNDTGLAQLKRGLGLLAERGEYARLHNAGNRIITELEGRSLKDEAIRISTWMQNNLPEGFIPASQENTRKVILPTHCPSCGAAMRSDEVAWTDKITVECAYCGSPVRGES